MKGTTILVLLIVITWITVNTVILLFFEVMLGAYKEKRLRRHIAHYSSRRLFWFKYEIIFFFIDKLIVMYSYLAHHNFTSYLFDQKPPRDYEPVGC